MTGGASDPHEGLRLLLIYDRIYPESLGGVEHRNLELAKALVDRGHDVTLAGFCRDLDPHPQLSVLSLGPPTETYTTDQRSTRAALRFATACSKLDLGSFDLVETANIPYAHLPFLAAKCRLQGKPFMVTWYEFWGSYWQQYLGPVKGVPYSWIESLCGQLGQAAVAVSGLTQGRLEHCRLSGKVDLVPCGLALETVKEAAASGASDGPPLIYAGRLLAEKRVDLLLEAMRYLHYSAEGPVLTIIGAGAQSQELKQMAKQWGLEDKVQFLGFLESNEEVWSRFRGARIAVQPSSREGFGLFPLEAMAVGLPVVYCESSENAVMELVEHGIHGICTEADPRALARALDTLLADPSECARLGKQGAQHAQSFDWQSIAEQFEDLALRMIREK